MNDWKRLIAELRTKGRMTKADIARALKVHVNTINLLERGTTTAPRYHRAEQLIALHAQRVKRAA